MKQCAQSASLVVNRTDVLSAKVRAVAEFLEKEFLASVAANIYCSFEGRQAFDAHYDDHEVFAVHVGGEKHWRVYEGRIDNPVGQPSPSAFADEGHKKAKGDILFEQTMRPGDMLYIPRGQYHEAVATGENSLHVSFSVFPLNGLGLFRLLEKAAVKQNLFRADLPTAVTPAGAEALQARLKELGGAIATMLAYPDMANEVMRAQQKLPIERSDQDLI